MQAGGRAVLRFPGLEIGFQPPSSGEESAAEPVVERSAGRSDPLPGSIFPRRARSAPASAPLPAQSRMAAPDATSPDEDLVARIRAGDESAFESVFRAHYDGLSRFAARMVGSDAEAEELTQEMLLRVWRRREELAISGSLAAYLYAAVRNESLNRLRRARAEQEWRERVLRERDAADAHRSAGADDDVRAAELAAAIERVIEELPPRRRQAYVLRRQHHLSYAEIAAIMEIAPKTVEIQIGAALRTLREKLADWL